MFSDTLQLRGTLGQVSPIALLQEVSLIHSSPAARQVSSAQDSRPRSDDLDSCCSNRGLDTNASSKTHIHPNTFLSYEPFQNSKTPKTPLPTISFHPTAKPIPTLRLPFTHLKLPSLSAFLDLDSLRLRRNRSLLFGDTTVLASLSHADRLPDILYLAWCLDESALRAVLSESIGSVLARVLVSVPMAHDDFNRDGSGAEPEFEGFVAK